MERQARRKLAPKALQAKGQTCWRLSVCSIFVSKLAPDFPSPFLPPLGSSLGRGGEGGVGGAIRPRIGPVPLAVAMLSARFRCSCVAARNLADNALGAKEPRDECKLTVNRAA